MQIRGRALSYLPRENRERAPRVSIIASFIVLVPAAAILAGIKLQEIASPSGARRYLTPAGGNQTRMTPKLFSELNLSAELLRAIEKLGFEQAAPIQAEAIPILM